MSQIWIITFYLGFSLLQQIDGHTDAEIQLKLPRYVERGARVSLECQHNVDPSVLFKVSWFRDEVKFFEYIKGRKPPFKNFTLDGADINWEYSNESQVTLDNVDFKLSGQFHCEVSMSSPLYTKASTEHLMSVFLPQTGPPVIRFRKRTVVAIGERLFALCNTTRARPAPHITWLINSKKVDDKYVRTHHVFSLNGKTHRRAQQQEQELDFAQAKQKKQQIAKLYQHGDLQSNYQQNYPHYFSIYQQLLPLPQFHTDRYDKSLRWSGNRPMEELTALHKSHHHHHGPLYHNNPFSVLSIMHDIDIDDYHEIQHRSNFDNKQHMETIEKHFDSKKHKNGLNRKYRHINENALGILRSTLSNGGFNPLSSATTNKNIHLSENSSPFNTLASTYGRTTNQGGGNSIASVAAALSELQQEKGLFSVSQLNIELTEEIVGPTGRMEITCLSTIPSSVGPGEQFADYKTYSIKVDVGRPAIREISSTSTNTPNIGMAALGNDAISSSAAFPLQVNIIISLMLLILLYIIW